MVENPGIELMERIKKNLLKGYKEDSLKWALINQGYSRTSVERAMAKAIKEIEAEKIEKEKQKPKAERPKITYQLYDENNKIVYGKKPFWKKLLGKE